jgi:hypothetical protein
VTETAYDAMLTRDWMFAPVVASLSALEDIRLQADMRACHGHVAAATCSTAGRARHVELRDGQIYRWQEPLSEQ